MQHQHPLKILTYSAKNLWLLIFPLIRGLLSIRLGDAQALIEWFNGAWFDMLIVLLILVSGYVRWNFSKFTVEDNSIVFVNGLLLRTQTIIPLKSISAITEEKSFYLRPFHATRWIVNTRAGNVNQDLTLMVNDKSLHYLRNMCHSHDTQGKDTTQFQYKPKFWNTVFFSFIFSNTITGAIYILVFLFKSGSVVEQFLQRSVLDEFNMVTENVTNMLMLKVPPILVGIALIIVFSWVLSFVANILRYTNFRIKKTPLGVFIRTGVVTRRRYKICENMVNYIDLCQNLLTKVFKFESINVNCSGYGSSKEEIPVFIPIMNIKDCQNTVSAIMPHMKIYPNNYKPKLLENFWKYTYPAIVPCLVVWIAYYVGVYCFPQAKVLAKFFTIMLEIPLLWYLVINIISLFTSGYSLKDDQLCIRYSKGFTFHTILVSNVKVAKVSITQTIFQKRTDNYNIVFYLTTEQSKGHKVKGMPKSAIEPFISKIG